MAVRGDFWWPSVGRSDGRPRGILVAACGEIAMAVDSVPAVIWTVYNACDRTGLPRIGAHRLRHTAASDMLRAGASLAEIGAVLRHRSPQTTAIYAKVDHRALGPLARPWPGGVQ